MLNHADGRWSLKMFHQEEPDARRGGRLTKADPQETARATEGSHLQNHNGGRPSAACVGASLCGEVAICWQIFSSPTRSRDPGRAVSLDAGIM